MICPIFAYGHPILRVKATPIAPGTHVQELVNRMVSTMHHAQGVGLAAPQIGQSIRLFVANWGNPSIRETCHETTHQVFINPIIRIDKAAPITRQEEGCLSIPHIMVEVPRREQVRISYFDSQWQWHEKVWTGFAARVLQHEYDHLEGILHIDYAAYLKKRLMKRRLIAINNGQVTTAYKMNFSRKQHA